MKLLNISLYYTPYLLTNLIKNLILKVRIFIKLLRWSFAHEMLKLAFGLERINLLAEFTFKQNSPRYALVDEFLLLFLLSK